MFGGICRETRECFLEVVEDRSAATLVPILTKYVLPGTIVHSDCWKAYSKLRDEGYIHKIGNHSLEFVNSDGTHTNTIESTWRAVKTSLPKSGTQKHLYTSHFAVYAVKQRYLKDTSDKFRAFTSLIKRVYLLRKASSTPRKRVATAESSVTAAVCIPAKRHILPLSADDSREDFV